MIDCKVSVYDFVDNMYRVPQKICALFERLLRSDHKSNFFRFKIINRSSGGGYLSTVCGTGTCHFLGVLFSNLYGIMGIIFTIF